ncbi:MAG: phage tail sheath family protein [Chloroflexi bacterium]|nr:MAG: phage tail sheath family protein [Phototrophicales bacterium]RMF77755.1 MAG: phage tail sheath family protein [Chloroflexota bacterium]
MTYLSPGVYVEEKPSAVQSIASNGTSTAGFIGMIGDTIQIPVASEDYDPAKDYTLAAADADIKPQSVIDAEQRVTDLQQQLSGASEENIDALQAELADAQEALARARAEAASRAGAENLPYVLEDFTLLAEPGEVIMCTNFSDFTKYFGSFSTDPNHNNLAHAVYGFFLNGGTICFVVRVRDENGLDTALKRFEAIDEIAIVAAPGLANRNVWGKVVAHCANMKDRFAVLDTAEAPAETEEGDLQPQELTVDNPNEVIPEYTKHGAVYFPWLQVVDPASRVMDPKNKLGSGGRIYIPPSGHIAGIYARTDTERGVHKAPANTPVRGTVGLRYKISKAQQDILNPIGINCIRVINGATKVWGARTIGGDSNGEWRYVNVRRTFINIMEDIDEGTQWVVFEPNTPDLWDKIVMNVSAYLTGRWRQGALFGTSPEQAFFVKCDFETNPPADRENGIVRTIVGVAIVRPAEFVVFEISQMAQQGG